MSPKPPHFPTRAKHVVFLFMNGAPSQVDTFDPKPALEKYHGTPYHGPHAGRLQRPAGRPPDEVAVPVRQARPERAARSAACFRTRPGSPTTCA